MKKFLLTMLAALIIFPAIAEAAAVRIPNIINVDRQNIECYGDGLYWCKNERGMEYADIYARNLQSTGSFRVVKHYTDKYGKEIWLINYIGARSLETSNWGDGWCHLEITADEFTIAFYLTDDMVMEG